MQASFKCNVAFRSLASSSLLFWTVFATTVPPDRARKLGRSETGNYGDTRKKCCADEKERSGTKLPKISCDHWLLALFVPRVLSFHGLEMAMNLCEAQKGQGFVNM